MPYQDNPFVDDWMYDPRMSDITASSVDLLPVDPRYSFTELAPAYPGASSGGGRPPINWAGIAQQGGNMLSQQAGGTGTVTGGLLGGAGTGANIGLMAGGPVGAGIGAGIGALVGGIGGLFSRRSRNKEKKRREAELKAWQAKQPKADSSRYDPEFQRKLGEFFAQYGMGGPNRINPVYNRDYYTNEYRDRLQGRISDVPSAPVGMVSGGASVPSSFNNYQAPDDRRRY